MIYRWKALTVCANKQLELSHICCVCSRHHIRIMYFIFPNLRDFSLRYILFISCHLFVVSFTYHHSWLIVVLSYIILFINWLRVCLAPTSSPPNNTVDALLHYFDIVPFIWSNRPSLWRSRRLGPPLCFFCQWFFITWWSCLSKSTAVDH